MSDQIRDKDGRFSGSGPHMSGVSAHKDPHGEDDRHSVEKDGKKIGHVFTNNEGGWTSSRSDRTGTIDFEDHKTKDAAIAHVAGSHHEEQTEIATKKRPAARLLARADAPGASDLIARFSRLLVPGWKVTFSRCRAEKMPIRGALAVCNPTPTRSLAHLYIVDPWPSGEDMEETIAHELTHAALSPFTTLLQDHPAAVMLEEQAVENIGKALASAPRAARAMARAVARYAPQLRARLKISAPLMRARDGGTMDGEMIKKAIAALKEGNGDAALAMLEEMVVAEASEGEPDGDEAPMEAQMAAPGDAPPAKDAPVMARKAVDAATLRARKAADEIEAIARDQRVAGKATLIAGLRARLPDHPGLPKIEKRIEAAEDYAAAKKLVDIAIDMAGDDGGQRARSGVLHAAAPASAGGTGVAPTFSIEDLKKEGIPAQLATEIVTTYKHDPAGAMAELKGARARLTTVSNPWATAPAQKGN